MAENETSKIEEATAKAEAALQIALNAEMAAQAMGTIMQSFIATLHETNLLTDADVKRAFLSAATSVDEMKPSSDAQRNAQKQMRAIVVHVAKNFDVQVPPPGQTVMRRKR